MASFSDIPGLVSPGYTAGFSPSVLWPLSVASQLTSSPAIQPSIQAANLALWASFGDTPQYWPLQVLVTPPSLCFSAVPSCASQVLTSSVVWNPPPPPPPPLPSSKPGSLSAEKLSTLSFVSVAPSAGCSSTTGWTLPFSQGSHLHAAASSTFPPIPSVWAPGMLPSFLWSLPLRSAVLCRY